MSDKRSLLGSVERDDKQYFCKITDETWYELFEGDTYVDEYELLVHAKKEAQAYEPTKPGAVVSIRKSIEIQYILRTKG